MTKTKQLMNDLVELDEEKFNEVKGGIGIGPQEYDCSGLVSNTGVNIKNVNFTGSLENRDDNSDNNKLSK